MSALRRVEWQALDAAARRAWLDGLRPTEPEADVSEILAAILERGDAALRDLTRRLDGVDLEDPWVSADELAAAEVAPALATALADAAASIGRYHAEQRNALREERRVRTAPGVIAWRRWQPIERVGGYVPGGRATYPSSVLMLAVPARLAGVAEVIIATPPRRDGSISPEVLVAARIGGVDRVLKAGGAQAIAALAFGTDSVPAVDKIFGAGNAWVTAAKRAVSGRVAIDLPAGPSECIVLADADGRCRVRCAGPPRASGARSRLGRRRRQRRSGPAQRRRGSAPAAGRRPRDRRSCPRDDRAARGGRPRGRSRRRHRGDQRRGGRACQPAMRRRRCARGARSQRGRHLHRPVVAGGRRRLRDRDEPHPANGCCGPRLERRWRRVVRSLDRAAAALARRRSTRFGDGEHDRRGRGPSGACRERSRAGRSRRQRAQQRRRHRALPPAGSCRPVPGRAVRRGARRAGRHRGERGRPCRHEHAGRRAAAGGGARARRLRRPSRDGVRRPRLRAAARCARRPAGRRPETDRPRCGRRRADPAGHDPGRRGGRRRHHPHPHLCDVRR